MKISILLAFAWLALWAGPAHAQDIYDGCNQPWGVSLNANKDFIEDKGAWGSGNSSTPPNEVKYYRKNTDKPGVFDKGTVYYETVNGQLSAIKATIPKSTTEDYKKIVEAAEATCRWQATTSALSWKARCAGVTAWAANGPTVLFWIENDELTGKARQYINKARGY